MPQRTKSKSPGRGSRGFTLVELIVVITILGILAGVGTVAYTGYITRAKMGVDQQTVGNLIYAAQLADYADSGLFGNDGSAMIVISEKGTQAAGGTDSTRLTNALENSVGDLAAVKLAYESWAGALDGETLKAMKDSLSSDAVGYTDSNGNILFKDGDGNPATIGYAANADTIWKVVEHAAESLASMPTSDKTPGEYLNQVASSTVAKYADGDAAGKSWDSSASLLDASGGMDGLINSMGGIVSRNYAFGEYLSAKNIGVSAETLRTLQADPNAQTVSLNDWVYEILSGGQIAQNTFGTELDTLQAAAAQYTTGTYTKEGSSETYSQAYLDGMVYYALMHNVNEVSGEGGKYDPTSDTYLADIGGYVSVAGSAFSGKMDWAGMVALADELASSGVGKGVVITATKSNGVLRFTVSPPGADPRGESEPEGPVTPTEVTSSLEVSLSENSLSINPSTIATKYGSVTDLKGTFEPPSGWDVLFSESNAVPSDPSVYSISISNGRKGPQIIVKQKGYGQNVWSSATVNVVIQNTTTGEKRTLSTTIDLYPMN